jgi:FixJ family two-component response regulator
MSEDSTTVFVVDDDPSVLKGLSRLLRSAGWHAVTYGSSDEFLRHYDPDVPGCLVLDIAMPGVDGLELQRRLVDAGCPLPIVFITGHGDIPTSVQAMRAGALNFLAKPVNDDDLLGAVREAVEKDRVARLAQRDMALVRERLATLTPREREVLDQVVVGKLNKQIAGDLGTVEKTIKVHRARVMEKMGARSLAELARMGERLGIGAPDAKR